MDSMDSKRVRSPSFPFISLPEAVHRARELFDAERRNLVHPDVTVAHWGYARSSSGGKQTIAALRAYGLLEDVRGELRLTDRAQHILVREPGSTERNDLLWQAALAPPLFSKLWERYRADLPSDKNLRSWLVLELKVNENAVEELLRSYRETLQYAGLLQSEDAPGEPRPTMRVAALRELTLSFPLGEFKAVRRIRPEETEMMRTLFDLWLRQVTEP
ncbi:MAG: hypothetical protein QOH06_1581 [Acidobacteriota bacterium]|nr:hypothetical protein [Acidobacteriota bacterium]